MNTPLTIRLAVWHYARQPDPDTHDPGKTGLVVNLIEHELCNIDPIESDTYSAWRHIVTGWLFTPDDASFLAGMSIRALTPQQVFGLWHWLSPIKEPISGEWLVRTEFRDELARVLARALSDLEYSMAANENGKPIIMKEMVAGYDDERGFMVRRALSVGMKVIEE